MTDPLSQKNGNNEDVNKQNVPELRYKSFRDEWEEKYLKDVCVINPKTEVPEIFNYIDLESVNSGILTYTKIINKNDAPSRAQRKLDKKDILFATVRPYQQNNYYFNLDGTYVASTGYAQIKAKENSQYLYYFLHTKQFLNEVMKRCTGTSYPAINSNDLKTIKIKIPSKNEQEKIASLFSNLDQKIEFMEKKRDEIIKLKNYFIQKLFCNKQNVPIICFNHDDYWSNKQIKDVAEVMGGGTPSTNVEEFWNGNINWFTPTEVGQSKYVSESERKITKDGLINSSAKLLPKNTILLTTRATIGRVSITTRESTTNQGFQSIICKNVDLNFMYYLIQTLEKTLIRKSVGSTFLEISKKEIENIEIKVPDINEQKKIGKFISLIDQKIELVEKEIKICLNFKKTLLNKMFC